MEITSSFFRYFIMNQASKNKKGTRINLALGYKKVSESDQKCHTHRLQANPLNSKDETLFSYRIHMIMQLVPFIHGKMPMPSKNIYNHDKIHWLLFSAIRLPNLLVIIRGNQGVTHSVALHCNRMCHAWVTYNFMLTWRGHQMFYIPRT